MRKFKYKQDAAGVIFFAAAHIKVRYDSRHKFLLFRSEEQTFLRLHKRYNIQNQHKKFENQRCELFVVKRRVERLAYELDISFKWKIYSVIFVTELEFALFFQNLYNRSKSNHFDSVYVEDDIEIEKSYEIKAIIDKRIRKFDSTSTTQYKIKWLKYDSEFDG